MTKDASMNVFEADAGFEQQDEMGWLCSVLVRVFCRLPGGVSVACIMACSLPQYADGHTLPLALT